MKIHSVFYISLLKSAHAETSETTEEKDSQVLSEKIFEIEVILNS